LVGGVIYFPVDRSQRSRSLSKAQFCFTAQKSDIHLIGESRCDDSGKAWSHIALVHICFFTSSLPTPFWPAPCRPFIDMEVIGSKWTATVLLFSSGATGRHTARSNLRPKLATVKKLIKIRKGSISNAPQLHSLRRPVKTCQPCPKFSCRKEEGHPCADTI
jgi:hypothetical protein